MSNEINPKKAESKLAGPEKQNKLIALDETTTTAKKYAVAIILQPRSFIFHEGSQTYRIFYQRSFPPFILQELCYLREIVFKFNGCLLLKIKGDR